MPHIVIKTIAGKPHEKLQEAAERIAAVVHDTMGTPKKATDKNKIYHFWRGAI